jgi:hypothetical protein
MYVLWSPVHTYLNATVSYVAFVILIPMLGADSNEGNA